MEIIAYIILIVSGCFFIVTLCNPIFNIFGSLIIDSSLASNFGSYIGGVLGPLLSTVSVLLLIKTIENQKKDRIVDQLRSHVYELIKYNRDVVNGFEYIINNNGNAFKENGDKFFIYAKRQIEEAINSVSSIIRKASPEQQVKIGYLVFYYGCGYESRPTLVDELKKIVSEDQAIDIVNILRLKKTEYDDTIQYYGGHQSRLSHYFRQLYYIVKIVDENKVITMEQKIDFIKILRVQMGNYEQGVLFYNSISSLGNPWSKIGKDGKSLIEKYELIKNIPRGFVKALEVDKVYKNIDYELT